MGNNIPKTVNGLRALAEEIVHGNKKKSENNFLNVKLEYGKYYEPVALKHYESFLRIHGYGRTLRSSHRRNESRARGTPNGKICSEGEFGILEIKCSKLINKSIRKIYVMFRKTHQLLWLVL